MTCGLITSPLSGTSVIYWERPVITWMPNRTVNLMISWMETTGISRLTVVWHTGCNSLISTVYIYSEIYNIILVAFGNMLLNLPKTHPLPKTPTHHFSHGKREVGDMQMIPRKMTSSRSLCKETQCWRWDHSHLKGKYEKLCFFPITFSKCDTETNYQRS